MIFARLPIHSFDTPGASSDIIADPTSFLGIKLQAPPVIMRAFALQATHPSPTLHALNGTPVSTYFTEMPLGLPWGRRGPAGGSVG